MSIVDLVPTTEAEAEHRLKLLQRNRLNYTTSLWKQLVNYYKLWLQNLPQMATQRMVGETSAENFRASMESQKPREAFQWANE